MTHKKSTVKIEQPLYTMNINQDPYHGGGGFDGSGEPGAAPAIDIRSITGVNLEQLDMPHMLEVLRGIYDREGTRYKYRPRGFRVQSQTGTITDIQASLYFRFKAAGEQIDHLIHKLKPMIPDPDLEDCEAARELVLEAVNELVEEARWQGGPRKLKLEGAFKKLEDYLRLVRRRFGLAESRARSQSEAENWSDFVTIKDIYADMKNSWELRKDDLDRKGDESYGNQVVWLNRLLGLVKEASARLRFQLKALLVGEAELSTAFINNDKLTIAELLEWTAEVCDRGLMISLRAGKDGMYALSFDLANLEDVYTCLSKDIDDNCDVPIGELCEEHIVNTIEDIVLSLQEAQRRASYASPGKKPWVSDPIDVDDSHHGMFDREEADFFKDEAAHRSVVEEPVIPPLGHPTFSPVVMGVSPAFGSAGSTTYIDIIGQHFHPDMLKQSIELFPNQIYQVIDCKYIDDTRLRLTVTLTSDPKWYGAQSLAVMIDTQYLWMNEKAFYVIPEAALQQGFSRYSVTVDVPEISSDEDAVTLAPIEISLDPSVNTKRLVIVPTVINDVPEYKEPPQKAVINQEAYDLTANKPTVEKGAVYTAEKASDYEMPQEPVQDLKESIGEEELARQQSEVVAAQQPVDLPEQVEQQTQRVEQAVKSDEPVIPSTGPAAPTQAPAIDETEEKPKPRTKRPPKK